MMDTMFYEICLIILVTLAAAVPIVLILAKKSDKKQLLLLGYLFLLVWIARFVVCLQEGFYTTDPDAQTLNLFERIFDSFVHSLQTFSMDEDYTLYTVFGRECLENHGYPILAFAYGIGISVLNTCAPVLGGAVILDILMGIFPELRLRLFARRHKFVFSELNGDSIALAEDINEGGKYRNLITMGAFDLKPMFLFANVCQDMDEEDPGLRDRLRNLGALCIRKDVLSLSLERSKSVNYFLIDSDPHANISTLTQLLEPDRRGGLRWPARMVEEDPVTRIFVFGQDDSGNALVRKICREHETVSEKVLVRPILDQMNAALNLMYEVPLFLPLLSRPREDLRLTVLGSGELAEEVWKAAYWCGQMDGVRLHIHVLAPDAKRMEQRIAEKYPEMQESCRPDSPLLRVFPHVPDAAPNPPYCATMDFADVADMSLVSGYPGEVLRDTDYYVVALESDERNLEVANQLKLRITRERIASGDSSHPVIAPAVEDQRLAHAARILKPEPYEPYFVPFASRESRYSCKNVFLTNFTERDVSIKSIYRKKNQTKDQNDIYATQSSAARAVHAPYKLFGMGVLRQVDLTEDAAVRYRVPEPVSLTREQEDRFAWVEHRRWNAYLRSQGFVCPTTEQYLRFFERTGLTKSIPLKLHPCLVESQLAPKPLRLLERFDDPEYDYLDYVAMYTYRLQSQRKRQTETVEALLKADYKQYDYMSYDAAVKDLLPPQT